MSETPDTTHQPDNRPSNEPQGSLPLAAGSAGWEWACVGHDPTQWALGPRKDNEISPVYAVIIRGPNGRWMWQVLGGLSGVEPSRETAMDAAESALPNAEVSRGHPNNQKGNDNE